MVAAASTGIKPHYELVNTTGPAHEQTFTVAAVAAR